jgi:hypothetical protein
MLGIIIDNVVIRGNIHSYYMLFCFFYYFRKSWLINKFDCIHIKLNNRKLIFICSHILGMMEIV